MQGAARKREAQIKHHRHLGDIVFTWPFYMIYAIGVLC